MPDLYLIPSLLHEEGTDALPFYITGAIRNCQVIIAENERTTRRFFKKLWKTFLPGEDMVIDDFEWHTLTGDAAQLALARERLKAGKNIGVVSEAGCPGVADPGQALVAGVSGLNGVNIKPLSGPSSVLLALMGSGMNGQQFRFAGYLPVDSRERIQAIRELESESARKNMTQIFIETPYRNNQLLEALLTHCRPDTRLCLAYGLTGPDENIHTHSAGEWKKQVPDLHKIPAIFLLYAGR